MEKLSLKWNNFHTKVAQSFGLLRKEEDFFDVTLVTDDEIQISAHKLVLATSSSFFKSILRKSSHSHPLLYLNGVDSKNLRYIIDYIYHGEIQIYQEELDSFLDVATKLKVASLIQDSKEGTFSDSQLGKHHSKIQDPTEDSAGITKKDEVINAVSVITQNTNERIKVNYQQNDKVNDEQVDEEQFNDGLLNFEQFNDKQVDEEQFNDEQVDEEQFNDELLNVEQFNEDQFSNKQVDEHQFNDEQVSGENFNDEQSNDEQVLGVNTLTLISDVVKSTENIINSTNDKMSRKLRIKDNRDMTYSCDLCDKIFATKGSVRTHIKVVHMDPIKFSCNHCDKKFEVQQNLFTHIQSSHEEMMYKCNQCDKRFSLSNNLRRHRMSKHAGGKNYPCNYCEFRTNRSDQLTQHIECSHMNLPCDKCEYQAAGKKDLRKHIRSMHNTSDKENMAVRNMAQRCLQKLL